MNKSEKLCIKITDMDQELPLPSPADNLDQG